MKLANGHVHDLLSRAILDRPLWFLTVLTRSTRRSEVSAGDCVSSRCQFIVAGGKLFVALWRLEGFTPSVVV